MSKKILVPSLYIETHINETKDYPLFVILDHSKSKIMTEINLD